MADSMNDVEMGSTGASSDVEDTNNPLRNNASGAPSAPRADNSKDGGKEEGVTPTYRKGKNKDATLAEKLRQLESGELDDKKIHERVSKFYRIIEEQEAMEDKKKHVIAFKYATDMSYLRNSTPDQMWQAVLRREAWAQGTWKMVSISLAQVLICLIVLFSQGEPINSGTVFMAVIYLVASSSTNPFEVTRDLAHLMHQAYDKKVRPSLALRIVVWIALVFLWPFLLLPFGVTFTLDMVVGKINNISYGEMVNIIVNFIVIFTGFSVGLRSGNPVNAVQTFAGFSFVGDMDELIISQFDVDMNALTSHKHGAGKQCKILTVRLMLYIMVPLLLVFFLYVTAVNQCFAFCNSS